MNREELKAYLEGNFGSKVALATVCELDSRMGEGWEVQDADVKREVWPVGCGKKGLKAWAVVYVQGNNGMIINGMAVEA